MMSLADVAKDVLRNKYLARFGDDITYAGASIKASISEYRKGNWDSEDGRARETTMTISVSTFDVPSPAIADVVTYGGDTYQVIEVLGVDTIMGAADLLIQRQDDIERSRQGYRRK